MGLPVILAHGTLGIWDEIIFVSIALIFIVMMGISWLRSRGDMDEDAALDHSDESVPPADPPSDHEPAAPDRFRLE